MMALAFFLFKKKKKMSLHGFIANLNFFSLIFYFKTKPASN
jgi:hypothetical protein